MSAVHGRADMRGRCSSLCAALSIGGTGSCNQRTVQCDYFPGMIHRIQIDAG